MPSLVITPDDVKNLNEIVSTFSKNVIANYGKPDAAKVFAQKATLSEKFGLVSSKLGLAMTAHRAPEKQARALLKYASKALKVMNRAFAPDLLARSLPQVGNEQRVIDICRDLGAGDIADLAEKARHLRNRPPAAPQSSPKA